MGKQYVIVIFLSLFAWAVYVFIESEPGINKNSEESQEKGSPISLRKFVYRRYKDGKLYGVVSADSATVSDPNIVTLSGSVRAERIREGESERLKAQSATITLNNHKVMEILEGVKIQRGELRDNVKLEYKDHTVSTEFAEYLPDIDSLQSQLPVKVSGPGRFFEGKEGFRYGMAEQKLDIFGEVVGTVDPSVR